MQPQNPNNYWQPGNQPAQPTPPHPVGPAPVASPAVPQTVAPPLPQVTQPPVSAPAPQSTAQPAQQPTPVAAAPQTPQPLQAPVPTSGTPLATPAPAPVAPVQQVAFTSETPQVAEQVAQTDADQFEQDAPDDTQAVSWEAQEFIHQEKGGAWFIVFTIVLIVLLAAAILLMKSWSFAILLVVIAAVIIVFAKRPPRVLKYSVTNKGLYIDESLHPFKNFKAFGVIHDGAEYSIMLIPTKRFMPGITVYFPEESGEQIVDMLGSRLPMQELHLDFLDRIIRKLRL